MKGYKNANHTWKHVVSDRKFSRMFSQNLDKAGVAQLYRNHNEGYFNSFQAVLIGDFIYARFACRPIHGNRLKTYCIRYKYPSCVDNIIFTPYTKKKEELF